MSWTGLEAGQKNLGRKEVKEYGNVNFGRWFADRDYCRNYSSGDFGGFCGGGK